MDELDDGACSRQERESIGVFIITHTRLYSDGIAEYLRASGRVNVVGVSADPGRAVEIVKESQPTVILLDMALDDSRESARALRNGLPEAAIIAIAVAETETDIVNCAEAGISAYVPAEGSLDDLLAAVLRAALGETVCSPRIAAGLFRRLAALSAAQRPVRPSTRHFARLTAREAEVVRLIDNGLSNKQIGRALSIGLPTVKNHVHSILEKLGASTRGEAAAIARDRWNHVPEQRAI